MAYFSLGLVFSLVCNNAFISRNAVQMYNILFKLQQLNAVFFAKP